MVLQETGSRPTYSRLNYVPSGDTLRRDVISSYIWFQYCVLHRILGVKELLVKMKISECNRCRLCDQSAESIIHLFSECTISNTL